ncbi:MAG TPA: hypothetical protein PLV92_27195, partial [Pirellulaceae bacterium]|nr:hypothetical protein [Pirellulaceae bacterium]
MDEKLVQSIDFVRELAGSAATLEQFDERETEKRGALDAMLADLSPDLKKQIRAGLDLRVEKKGRLRSALKKAPVIGGTDLVDRVGSEKLTDTEAATQKGYGLAADDAKRAHEALEQVIALTKKAIDAKGKDGAPLFTSPDEIEAEVFTPLVREGVLPDNFVVAKYSEVQKLLDATFKGYKQRLQDSVDSDRRDSAKTAVNAAGGGSKLDRATGLAGRFAERVSNVIDSIASEDTRRRLGIVVDLGATFVAPSRSIT